MRYQDVALFTRCAIGILRHFLCVLSGCALSGCSLSGITANLLCAIGMCAIAPCANGSRSAVSQTNAPSYENTEIQQLITSIAALNNEVVNLEKKLNALSRSKSNSRRRKSLNSPNRGGTFSLCAAHIKYPNNPTSCREWCAMYETWKKTKN